MRRSWRARLLFLFALAMGMSATAAPFMLRFAVEARGPVRLYLPTAVTVLDHEGRLLRAYTVEDGLWRLPVTLTEVDPLYVRMLEAIEDRRFRTHRGVDPLSVLRAGGQLVLNGRIVSGASTLTMQVVRLASRRSTRSSLGKLMQALDALALERFVSKEQILEAYFMLAPFGGNIEGVRAASLSYFGKEPRRLTPAEAALLVALPQAPEARRPDRHPEAAKLARDRILARAAARGVISVEEAAAAMTEEIPVRRQPFPLLAAQSADHAKRERPDLAIHRLTLDRDLQEKLERLAKDRARAIDPMVSVAIVVAEIESGAVRAAVASADLLDERRAGFVDMTRALRSPGSTLKPFIYGLAFEEGIAHPSTLVEDRPMSFSGYRPENFDKVFRGTVTVRQALELSLNIPAVAVLEVVGPARLVARLKRAGVEPRLPDRTPSGLAIGLGGIGLSLRDLTQLYVALARDGQPIPLIERMDETPPATPMKPLMEERAALYVTDILAGPPSITVDAPRFAMKTGTSYGYRDAWAVGYDARHVIAVWIGRPDGAPMPGFMGTDIAVPVLRDSFVRAGGVISLPLLPPDMQAHHGTALPPPLQRLARGRVEAGRRNGPPAIVYPPHGARVALAALENEAMPLTVKVSNGRAPFIWFADGAPVGREAFSRQFTFTPDGNGFVTLSVVDAEGRSDRVTVFVERE